MTSSKVVDEQRIRATAKKQDREREASQAMREYRAESARVDANTARLRALRLAKETAEAKKPVTELPPKKKAAARTTAAVQGRTRSRKSA